MANNKIIDNIVLGSSSPILYATNRYKQFGWILKREYGKLFLFNVFSFLFAIPIILVLIFLSYAVNSAENVTLAFRYLFNIGLLIIPSLLIFSIGMSGLNYAIRNLIYVDLCPIRTYFEGIKKNIKRFLLIYLLLGLSMFIMLIDVYYYTNISNLNIMINTILSILGIVQFIIIFIMSIYQSNIEVRYINTLKQLLSNSFKLTIGHLFKNILFISILICPLLIMLILPGVYQILVLSIYMFIGLAISTLGISLYISDIFDNDINKIMYKELYRKGLKDNN